MDTKQTVKNSPRWFRLDWACIILFLGGVLFLIESLKLVEAGKRTEPLGSGGWPLIMSAIWVAGILGVMAYEAFKRLPVPSYKINMRDIGTIRCLWLVVFMLLYIFLVRRLGFVITTIVFEFALMVALGGTSKRHLILSAITAVIVTLVVYYCYTLAFEIPLPGQL